MGWMRQLVEQRQRYEQREQLLRVIAGDDMPDVEAALDQFDMRVRPHARAAVLMLLQAGYRPAELGAALPEVAKVVDDPLSDRSWAAAAMFQARRGVHGDGSALARLLEDRGYR